MNLSELTAQKLLSMIQAKEIKPSEVFTSLLNKIKQADKNVKAYVRVNENAPSDIDNISADTIPLPLSLKDNMCLKGIETTCCSKILKGFTPPYNATVVNKILESNGYIIGQTNMDEFAFGSSTENSCYGPTHNPWDLDCVVGGSSGGSAAAVAADEAIWALGSDTGGSIRQPAALCGIVGMKPTYGRVSRYGLIAFASSLDQIGPMTKDVRDAALLLNIIAGHDEHDSTSADMPVPNYLDALNKDVKGLTIGIPKEYFVDGMDAEVTKAVQESIEVLKKSGVNFKEISLPHTEYAVATYYIIATAEASSNLARYDGVQYGLRAQPDKPRLTSIVDMFEESKSRGFGQEVKRRVMLGTYALSSGYYDAYYLRAQKVRTLFRNDFEAAFNECDAILTPTSPTTAFKIGEKIANPLAMYLSDIFTISANLSGIPAMSIPCGFSKSGLPIGLQIMAKPFDEEMMLRIAYAYEQATDWHKQKAKL